MHVTGDRIILLDCQPVLSSSVVLDMIMEGAELPDGAVVRVLDTRTYAVNHSFCMHTWMI